MLFLLLLTLSFGVRGQTPSSLLGPGHFSYHPIVRQYLEETSAAPTKQGPVVFPPSPSPLPQSLVVTPRTLNNSQTASSAVRNVYRPFRYRPFVPVPYGDKTYDFEQPTLPPIYKALSNQANNNLIKVMRNNEANIRRPKNEDNQYNDLSSEDAQNQKYAFSYTVKDHKTGDDFSHSQHSSGSATNGEYRVRLPDGRTQIVSYTADENGYKADVRYDNDDSGFNANNYDNTIKYNANNNAASNNAYKFDVVNNNNAVSNAYKFDVVSNIGNKAVKYNAIDNYDANNNVASNNAHRINVGNNAIKYNTFDANNNNVYKQRLDTVYTDAIDSRNNDYDYKREEIPIKEEVNEYNDYSAEYHDKGYNTANKFAVYDTETKFVPTVRPSYEEIKDLFTKIHVTTPAYNFQVTPTPDYQKFNNEKVVVLGNRYTDVRSTLANYQNPTTPYFIPDPVTIKPILSQNYINRINKYLTFN